jgi:hypothetical protein
MLNDQKPLAGNAALVSPSVSDDEWIARTALNDYSTGVTEKTMATILQLTYAKFRIEHPELPWVVNPNRWSSYAERRRAAYQIVAAKPEKWFEHFSVRYVALPLESGVPPYLAAGWHLLTSGPYWRVWRRSEAQSAAQLQRNHPANVQSVQLGEESCCVF